MPYSIAAKNQQLDATPVAALSLHSTNPGATGAGELSGGIPAYARKAPVGQTAAANGVKHISNSVTFDVPAGASVQYVGQWSGDATPVWLGYDEVTLETFQAQGTYIAGSVDNDLNATASA